MIEGLRIEWAEDRSPHFDQSLRLTYAVLYRDFGVPPDGDWYHIEPDAHAVALVREHLVGTGRLLGKASAVRRQLRQIAVEPVLQGEGIGTSLVETLERRAASEGAREVWLNARDTAFAFYERMGYRFDSPTFISPLTGIPHRRMVKRLAPPPS